MKRKPSSREDTPLSRILKKMREDTPAVSADIDIEGEAASSDSEEKTSDHFRATEKHMHFRTYWKDQPLVGFIGDETKWNRAYANIHLYATALTSCLCNDPWTKPEDVYIKAEQRWRKAGVVDRRTIRMMRGKELEPLARQFLRDQFHMNVMEVGSFVYSKDPRIAAKPDGIVVGCFVGSTLTNLEIKCIRELGKRLQPRGSGIPLRHLLQIYVEMACEAIDDTLLLVWGDRSIHLYKVDMVREIWDNTLLPRIATVMEHLSHRSKYRSDRSGFPFTIKERENIIAAMSKGTTVICKIDTSGTLDLNRASRIVWYAKHLLVRKDVLLD